MSFFLLLKGNILEGEHLIYNIKIKFSMREGVLQSPHSPVYTPTGNHCTKSFHMCRKFNFPQLCHITRSLSLKFNGLWLFWCRDSVHVFFFSVTCFFSFFSALSSSLSLMKDYFFKPPINKLSLNFLEKSLESAYRKNYQQEVHTHTYICFSLVYALLFAMVHYYATIHPIEMHNSL